MPPPRVTVGGFRLAALAARAVPALATPLIAPALGVGANALSGDKRAMLMRHLQRADPSLSGLRLRRAAQEAFDSYSRYWLESFRLPHLSPAAVARGMRVEGYPHVTDALDPDRGGGNGVILALPHLGGWEWAGRWLIDNGLRVTVVVERLDPPELFEWFTGLRESLGMRVLALGPSVAGELLGALRRNEVVCLLCDRDIQRSGIPVEFFGETTTLPAGPATLALRTGAPILPTAVYFSDPTDGHLGLVRPPIDTSRSGDGLRADVTRVTQALAGELEYLIRRAPTQWHLLQPNWPSDPGYDGPALTQP